MGRGRCSARAGVLWTGVRCHWMSLSLYGAVCWEDGRGVAVDPCPGHPKGGGMVAWSWMQSAGCRCRCCAAPPSQRQSQRGWFLRCRCSCCLPSFKKPTNTSEASESSEDLALYSLRLRHGADFYSFEQCRGTSRLQRETMLSSSSEKWLWYFHKVWRQGVGTRV